MAIIANMAIMVFGEEEFNKIGFFTEEYIVISDNKKFKKIFQRQIYTMLKQF